MKRRINHRQLEAFQAVMDSGTVTAAAERLYITQPAVTRLIRDLEHAVGFALFERRKGRLSPTVEAQFLFDEVERSFAGLDKILQSAEDIRTLNAGSLRIAALPALALGFLPRVICKFSDRHPNVNISLQIRSSMKVMEWIASQQFNIGFAAVQHEHPAVEQALLLEAPYVAVMPEGHRLAAKRLIGPADFQDETFISLGPELNARGTVDAIFAEAKVSRRLVLDTQLASAACMLVAEGGGVALVEPFTAADFLGRGIVARPFRPTLTFKYSLLFPLYRSRSRLVETFIEQARTEIADNPLLQ